MQMVKLLIEHGADLFVLSEGDSPFATARLAGHDEICEFLARLMKKAKESDPNIWLRSRLGQLQREIADIQKKLAAEKQTSIQANSRSS